VIAATAAAAKSNLRIHKTLFCGPLSGGQQLGSDAGFT